MGNALYEITKMTAALHFYSVYEKVRYSSNIFRGKNLLFFAHGARNFVPS